MHRYVARPRIYGQQERLHVRPRRGYGALRGRGPRYWRSPDRRYHSEDPVGHRAEAEEIAHDILRQPRDQVDDEAEDGSFGLHDEPYALPHLGAHQPPYIGRPEPPSDPKGEERTGGQSECRVEEPEPLPKDEATEQTGDLAGNGRDDDLQGLNDDEDERGQHAPLAEGRRHEVLVQVEPYQEAIDRRTGDDEPGAD